MTDKDKIIYASNGLPAFHIQDDGTWDFITPDGIHQWLKENNKTLTKDGKIIDKKRKI